MIDAARRTGIGRDGGQGGRPARSRGAFTLVELCVAFGVALVVFLVILSNYADYSQIYRHQEEIMQSARDAQIFLSAFKDDVRTRSSDPLYVIEVPEKALQAIGYPKDPVSFFEEPRRVSHIHNFYSAYEGSLSYSERTTCTTWWRRDQEVETPAGRTWTFKLEQTRWLVAPRDRRIADAIAGSEVPGFIHVRIPHEAEKPDASFLLLKRESLDAGPHVVLYAYHRTGKFGQPPHTLLRWSGATKQDLDDKPAVTVIGRDRVDEDLWLEPVIERAAWNTKTGALALVPCKTMLWSRSQFVEAEGGRFALRRLRFPLKLATSL